MDVVYVDSNSTDGSRELASSRGATVVHLTEGPYTPSRGRQVGLEELLKRHPELPYVHFIDGDCVLAPGWVETAYRYLETHSGVGAVFGRRREERRDASLYSRLMDIDWEHSPGEAANFGGDFLARVEAVRAAGGWSAETINAEDIDLSFRMRAAGWTIRRLAEEMTSHDVRMSRFREYWKRQVRAGYGYIEVGWRHRHTYGRLLLRRMASALLYGGVVPVLGIVGLLVFWPLAALAGLAYLWALARLARRARRCGAGWGSALAYGGLNLVCKTAALVGVSRYLLDRLLRRGRPSDHLIVYRSPQG